MKRLLLIVAAVSLFASPAHAVSTIMMCPGGRVESGDTKEIVKRKCGKPYSYSNSMFKLNGKNERLKVDKIKFQDGTKVAFLYVQDKLIYTFVIE